MDAILKLDDLREGREASFRRMADLAKKYDIKMGFGVVMDSVAKSDVDSDYIRTLKEFDREGIEIWHHGYYHIPEEYSTEDREAQLRDFGNAQRVLKEKCNITAKTFGSPYNNANHVTVSIINEHFPDITSVLLLDKRGYENSHLTHFTNRMLFEEKTGTMATLEAFIEDFEKHRDESPMVLQAHPCYFEEISFERIEQIIAYLKSQGVNFVLARDIAQGL